jgi:hypothetical protein
VTRKLSAFLRVFVRRSSASFMPAYVAPSRLRSLEGLILLSPLRMNVFNDQDVMDYGKQSPQRSFLKNSLH